MSKLTPSARLQVKADTFFLPVPNDGVYFRNNVGTFHMQGEMIYRWLEKLIPMFNGEHTLAELTDGLSGPHRDRVYEIAEVLRQKGFARDASLDRPHVLSEDTVRRYAGQIAFLESFGDSGAYRFQCYRQAKVLAVGSGPMFASLVSALLESGLPRFRMLITDSLQTDRRRLTALAEHARLTDSEVEIRKVTLPNKGADAWREAVRPFDTVLYVSEMGDGEEFRLLRAACQAERKTLLPAVCLHQAGIAGPLVQPESVFCWDSAVRRIHKSEVCKDKERFAFSSTAGALLANVIVFEHFKQVTGAAQPELRNSLYLLDLETLEGNWRPFLPHPLAAGKWNASARWVDDVELRLEERLDGGAVSGLFSYLGMLTSERTGILHRWEEGDLRQLPLSQCRVQAANPLSEGPADLLPEMICSGLTHEEARRESGFAGLESYVSRLAGALVNTEQYIGIGVGETAAEGLARGLQACLAQHLGARLTSRKSPVTQVGLGQVDDERCLYYLQALTTMRGQPSIGLGEEVSGFPAVWVGTEDGWFGGTGLTVTTALRTALQAALMKAQNGSACRAPQAVEAESVQLGPNAPLELSVPAEVTVAQPDAVRNAMRKLKRSGREVYVIDLAVEPFLREGPVAVFGVLLGEGEAG
ncbi:putative thiazole-containing bacteriocin maturation protein [Paenibacillus mucilaginosus]|uniref:Group-specific protein n=1 Tax=Paenibacillus mucilaginosus (strain KNP414) TaxID=1036673 RepID=F8FKA2_PAEMK|nr:putative thiazole-containing bacteriocin maturation protein [Paenibacillus mucilaginosus]AEI44783.1 group-specific protein [Paenibacillus mucilaginosus KNP414]MCG7214833.1 putative thiazole-containing bacteriocin maturation protein [Paenibacillus mucilaginosus]WDM26316.1 putative thiazole-containing bacteriocin maturation protein [Paenibacillus mucilaginosus]